MELKVGNKFTNVHMPDHGFEVLNVIPLANQLTVEISPNQKGRFAWQEVWNLEHSKWAFERGEYNVVEDTEQPSPTIAEKKLVGNDPLVWAMSELRGLAYKFGGEIERVAGLLAAIRTKRDGGTGICVCDRADQHPPTIEPTILPLREVVNCPDLTPKEPAGEKPMPKKKEITAVEAIWMAIMHFQDVKLEDDSPLSFAEVESELYDVLEMIDPPKSEVAPDPGPLGSREEVPQEIPYGTEVKPWDSYRLIGEPRKRFEELIEKEYDWHSFYHAWLEGRAEMLKEVLLDNSAIRDRANKRIAELEDWIRSH